MISPMVSIDPERERQRLVQLYSGMADQELQELADNYADLTDIARKALKDEMGRRGLGVEDSEQSDAIEERKLITVSTFKSLGEALLAKGLLESCGIECFIADDNMARMETAMAIGMRLRVKPEDAEAAIEILDQPIPDEPEDER